MAVWLKGSENGKPVYTLKGTYIDIRLFDQGYAVFKGGVMTDGGPYKHLSSAKRAGEKAWLNRDKSK